MSTYFKNYPVPSRIHMTQPFSIKNPCFNKIKPGDGYYTAGTKLGSSILIPMHAGTDLYGDVGDLVCPCRPGTVFAINPWGPAYGRHQVLIRHVIEQTTGPDLVRFSFYAHMEARYCNEDEKVTEKFHIGRLGEEGYVTGPHVHFTWQASPHDKHQVIDAGAKHLPEIIQALRAA